jgi:uncharacterized protein (DUF2147 family)
MKSKLSLFFLSFAVCLSIQAQDSIFGKWKTIDDATGKPRAVVEIYQKDGKAYGKIIQLFRSPEQDQDPICDKCNGVEHNKKVIGLEILKAMEKDGDEWEDGTILDTESGKVYDCKLWLEDGKLMVRGYIAFFFRTQQWLPYK